MVKFIAGIALLWALGSVGVIAIEKVELPGSNVISASAVASQAIN